MEPTFDDVLYLYTRFHGRHPTTEERGALEPRLRFGHVLEPPWERLARPTDLGPSRLGLLWLVLESGPGGRHPGVVAALEGLRGASEVGEALSFEPLGFGAFEALFRRLTTRRMTSFDRDWGFAPPLQTREGK